MEEEEEEEEESAACSNDINGGSINGVVQIESTPDLKSILKKKGSHLVKIDDGQKKETRRITWADDAHGTEIAHVRFFESSRSNGEELEGVRNSCVCVIQ